MRTARDPERPDEAPSQRRVERRWLPLLAVLGVIALITGGGRSVSDAIAGPPEPAFDLTPALRIHPAAGWVAEGFDRRAGVEAVVLARGTAVLRIEAILEDPRAPQALMDGYVEQVLRQAFVDLTLGEPEAAIVDGAPAARAGYLGTTAQGVSVEGIVVVTVAPSGAAVVFDAGAPAGDLAWAGEDVVSMIRTAELR